MRLKIIGSGDAFGSGGRFNTAFLLQHGDRNFLVDCGASTLVALRKAGIEPRVLDGIILSHLHGDHFGGLPFLLLDAQFGEPRDKPFSIAGPPGTAERLRAALEVFFPGSSSNKWRFSLDVIELPVGETTVFQGLEVQTTEVIHRSGAPSTALRISVGSKVFAYSGDTAWTDALLPIADGADLFIVECYDYDRELPGHMNWQVLRSRLVDLHARKIMLTHMNPSMLAKLDEVGNAGILVAEDGMEVEI